MVKTPNIDPEQLKADALLLKDAVAVQAGRAAIRAAELAEQGIDWATPRAQAAVSKGVEKATPVITDIADRAQEAAAAAMPYIDSAHDKVVEDYLPRINKAVTDAGAAATSDADLADRARAVREASAKALTTPTAQVVKKHRTAKVLGWTALGVSAAGVGYLLWKRSQPIEDPWAEEYWADLEADDNADVPDMAPESTEDTPTEETPTEEGSEKE